MRFFITVLFAAGVATLLVLDNPARASRLWESVLHQGQQALDVRDVRVEGLSVLSRTEIEKLLPLGKSAVWWKLHETDIRGSIERNPWVSEASVSRCPGAGSSSWGCYVVSIKERVPTYTANVDNTDWIIDRDGSFITTRADAISRGYIVSQLIAVRGLASRSSSPDVVRAQLAAATGLVDTLQGSVRRDVERIEFREHGDFSVAFKGLSFPVIFGAGPDAKIPLHEQGVRCAELLKRLQQRIADIKEIDLAFDRVGVVKFHPESETTGENQSS